MATRLPTVRVTRHPRTAGFLVTCTACPLLRAIYPTRNQADADAHYHRASHQTPTHEED